MHGADAHALHTARISVNDFDVEAGGMVQDFTALRQAAGQRHGEARDRVELALVVGQREARRVLLDLYRIT